MILSPEATQEDVSTTVDRVDGLIVDQGGTVSDHETWGVRRLAYPIQNFTEGNYVLTRFAVDTSAVRAINRTLEASADVLEAYDHEAVDAFLALCLAP